MEGVYGERRKIQPWPLKDQGGEGTGNGSIMFGKETQMVIDGLHDRKWY
jgi:hypothetical protein